MSERVSGTRQADEWLRNAESALGIGFWTWNAAEARLICSQGLFDLVGVNPAGVQLDPMFMESLVHPKDRLTLDDAAALVADPRQFDRRFRVIRPDGELRWLRSQARSFFDRTGNLTKVVASVVDFTEDQSLRRRASNMRALLHNVSSLTGAALWIAREDGQLIERICADQDNELPDNSGGALPWRDIVHPDDLQHVPATWLEAVRGKTIYRFQGRVRMADGEYHTIHAAGLPFPSQFSPDPYWGGVSARDTRLLSPSVNSDDTQTMLLSPGQVRACRALLDWSAEKLSAAAGVSVSTIRRLESNEVSQGQGDSMRLVMIAFREAGLRIWRGDDDRFCVSDLR